MPRIRFAIRFEAPGCSSKLIGRVKRRSFKRRLQEASLLRSQDGRLSSRISFYRENNAILATRAAAHNANCRTIISQRDRHLYGEKRRNEVVRNTFVYERVEFYRSSEKWWKDSLGENDGRSHSLPDLFHRTVLFSKRKRRRGLERCNYPDNCYASSGGRQLNGGR